MTLKPVLSASAVATVDSTLDRIRRAASSIPP
jgi:hypothetical protein